MRFRQFHVAALIILLLGFVSPLTVGNVTAAEMLLNSSQQNRQVNSTKNKDTACSELSAQDSTRLGLIKQMLTNGKPHAAIAFLDAAKITDPQAELLRADGLRQTGREEEAAQIYQRLLGNCMAGYAYQGLGLIASKAGKVQEAVAHLRSASAALPTEHTIRNDYGYVLMVAGDNKAALHEFLTAVELAANYRQAAHNLILLLYRDGQDERAKTFASQFGISKEEMAHLQEMAKHPLPNANITQDKIGAQ